MQSSLWVGDESAPVVKPQADCQGRGEKAQARHPGDRQGDEGFYPGAGTHDKMVMMIAYNLVYIHICAPIITFL